MAPNFPSHKSKTNSFHISGRYPSSPTPSPCSNLKFEGVSKNGSLALLVSGLRGRHPMATSRRLRTVGSAFATNNGSRTRRRGTERPREAHKRKPEWKWKWQWKWEQPVERGVRNSPVVDSSDDLSARLQLFRPAKVSIQRRFVIG